MEARPPAGAYAAGAPLLMSKAGGKPAGRGISIFPALHPPLETTKKGKLRFPFLELPPSCSTGNIPAAKAYFVTPPPLGAGAQCAPLQIATVTTQVFQWHGTDGGPAGQAGTAQPLSGLAG